MNSDIRERDFGDMLRELKKGHCAYRRGWNGEGIYIRIQRPDEHSFMSQPYIYIDTTSLLSRNPNAPRGRVPWFASQTDLLAEDWVVVPG